ncbi:P-loop containing nucleoside triphosphate hydrolase protein [Epithele typhae]|uniref:P-loop containing nucleoside triphosphate hydrolase protein n=1 Tax=Epithele typhae TaxID=378194 RepID=UPI0020088075|nr:P-loop containing nucleoside triphosphate hydrolase protein [Epithele typhae]KAH9934468.1 P-loop containing nucleoside triphosphate hydrolase protein [Epithele typhae]
MPAQAGEMVEFDPTKDNTPEVEEVVPEGPPGSLLEIKYLHEIHDMFKNQWMIRPAPPASEDGSMAKNDATKYNVYAFSIIRKFNHSQDGKMNTFNVTTVLQINSPELVDVGQDVIGHVQGISWTAKPLRIDPHTLLAWVPELQTHAEELEAKIPSEPEDSPLVRKHKHLAHLLGYLRETYGTTLDSLASLLQHDEITFDLLWSLFVPGKTVLYTLCPITSEPRCVRLVHSELCQKADNQAAVSAAYDPTGLLTSKGSTEQQMQYFWRLVVEYVEVDIGAPADDLNPTTGSSTAHKSTFGYAGLGRVLDIQRFKGTKKISSLLAYPVKYYPGPGGVSGLRTRLIERGRKWATLAGGMHHVAYRGLAFRFKEMSHVKYSVNSRIMIDRKTFADTVPNYPMLPRVSKNIAGQEIDRHAARAAGGAPKDDVETRELTDDELFLTSPIVYGFSFADKQWFEFIVERVESFEWNDEAFKQLVIPAKHKQVLKTLVESHNAGSAKKFDDFVAGKGHGLVINLFGNPGTGKSLTAEAMSEYVRKPLYVVGAADLGTHADALDTHLTAILKVSAIWGAVVLIDEADVFLEERTLAHLERNAMVAVFLRQLEYFRGILFLTTNRVRVFDEAFQSRIHVSLRYADLSPDAKRQIWLAFLKRVNGADLPYGGLSAEDLRSLGEKKVNGRQIKNIVKTAGALAQGRQERLAFVHLEQVLDLMEQFDTACVIVPLLFALTA